MASRFVSQIPIMRSNLLARFDSRTPSDESAGFRWYDDAQDIIRQWSRTYDYPVSTVAAVTAAISPQCEWTRNIIIADDILAGRAPSIGGAFHANLRKAVRIRDDRASDIRVYMPYGYKVYPFSRNLMGDYSLVTVDTHGIQAALDDVEVTLTLGVASYPCFQSAYEQAASVVGLAPAIFQAVVWHVWRRLYPRVEKIRRRKQWHVICTEQE